MHRFPDTVDVCKQRDPYIRCSLIANLNTLQGSAHTYTEAPSMSGVQPADVRSAQMTECSRDGCYTAMPFESTAATQGRHVTGFAWPRRKHSSPANTGTLALMSVRGCPDQHHAVCTSPAHVPCLILYITRHVPSSPKPATPLPSPAVIWALASYIPPQNASANLLSRSPCSLPPTD